MKKLLLIFTLELLTLTIGYSQNYEITNFYASKGGTLPQKIIKSITIDKKNQVWFNCIGKEKASKETIEKYGFLEYTWSNFAKYDGENWQSFGSWNTPLKFKTEYNTLKIDSNGVYYFINNEEISIVKENVWTTIKAPYYLQDICFDKKGVLWAIHPYEKAFKYQNGEWLKITKFNSDIISNDHRLIYSDLNGDIWLESYEGISIFNGKEWKIIKQEEIPIDFRLPVAINFEKSNRTNNSQITWFISKYSLVRYKENKWTSIKPIVYFEVEKKQLENKYNKIYKEIVEKRNLINKKEVYGKIENNNISLKINAFDQDSIDNKEKQAWMNKNKIRELTIENPNTCIAIDSKGFKWIGTNGSGLLKYDGYEWKLFNKLNNGLINDTILSITIDKDDKIWVGTINGVSLLTPKKVISDTKAVSDNLQKDSKNDVIFDNNTPKIFPNLKIKNLKVLDNNQVLEANEKLQISFLIKNEGKGLANEIVTKISNPNSINGIEFKNPSIVSNLKAFDSVKVITTIFGNINLKNANAKILFSFDEKNGFPPDPIEVTIATKEFTKPNIKIVDYAFSSEQGTIKQGVPINLKTIIQNTGQGDANDISIKFKWPSINVATISESNFTISELKAGESKEINFEFIVNKLYNSTTVPIKIELDEKYHKFFENKEVFTTLNSTSNITSIKVESNYQEKKIEINEVSLTSDVDKNIPKTNLLFPNKYALIIGNEDYSSRQPGLNTESNVEFAVNDAKSFKEYAVNVLGIPKENCFLILNGTTGEMTQKINVITQLLTKLGDKGEFIFYYAGHGFPDEVTKTPYLIPVDVSATNLQSAIKVTDLYQKLIDTKAKRITVLLDACFTGGGRDQGLLAVRGVKIVPKTSFLNGNMAVFTATNNEQSALPYKEKQHGMFTYYLLKKLQETNGNISYLEMQNYIKEKVSIQSLKVNSKSQDPQINVSPEVLNEWENWRFN